MLVVVAVTEDVDVECMVINLGCGASAPFLVSAPFPSVLQSPSLKFNNK